MNEQEFEQYKQAILNAKTALQHHLQAEARMWAQNASLIAPDREEPWLLLAAASKPSDSIKYLQRALTINPHSERAAAGMQWALNRLAQTPIHEPSPEPHLGDTQPIAAGPSIAAAGLAGPAAVAGAGSAVSPDTQPLTPAGPGKAGEEKGKQAHPKRTVLRTLLIILIILLLLVTALVLWAAIPSWIAQARSAAAPIPANMLVKPSLTPTATATFTPTPTSTPTSTPTNTPTPTETPTPTPLPTETPYPTEIPSDLVYQEPPDLGIEGRWIDIDLSDQMLYAYDGNVLDGAFLVSTGTWQHPTVTGQFKIYVKYRYTDMRGPGYYLPDVPYTMYFYEGYGIHGTYWHSNFGTPMSHGCVNMETSDAEWMFYWASVGTIVNVHD